MKFMKFIFFYDNYFHYSMMFRAHEIVLTLNVLSITCHQKLSELMVPMLMSTISIKSGTSESWYRIP